MTDYVPTDWVEHETLVDAARMNKIEAGIDTAHDEAHAAQADADAAQVAADEAANAAANAQAAADAAQADADAASATIDSGRLGPGSLLISDWNAAIDNGWYHADPGAHAPSAFAGSLVIGRVERAEGFVTQTCWQYALANSTLAPKYERRYDGSWGPWLAVAGGGGGADLSYDGDWVAGTYQDGDVVIKDGIAYLCVGGPTTVAPDPAPWGAAGLPPVVNGQWIKGVGGAAVWSPITVADVAGAIGGHPNSSMWPAGAKLARGGGTYSIATGDPVTVEITLPAAWPSAHYMFIATFWPAAHWNIIVRGCLPSGNTGGFVTFANGGAAQNVNLSWLSVGA
jgi:hypothetical protein